MAIIEYDPNKDSVEKTPIENAKDELWLLVRDAYFYACSYRDRSGMSHRLRNAYNYLHNGRIDSLVFKETREDEDCDDCGSEFSVNLDFIRIQHETAVSILSDALKSRGEDYSSIEPTPIPEGSKVSEEIIEQNAFQAVMREIVQGIPAQTEEEALIYAISVLEDRLGTTAGLEYIEEITNRQKQIENSKMHAAAMKKSRHAKTHIDDKLVESNFESEIKKWQSSVCWYDLGILFGAYQDEVETTEVTKDGCLRETCKSRWAFKNINPLDYFFSECTTYCEMGDYEGDIVYMTKNDLLEYSKSKHAEEEKVKEVLEDFDDFTHGFYFEETKTYSHQTQETKTSIPVMRIYINICDDLAKELFNDKDLDKKRAMHLVEVHAVNEGILGYKLYPRHLSKSPYHKMSFNMPEREFLTAGRGIYSLCRTAQEMIDNALIGLFNNMQDINRYILEVNAEKLIDVESIVDRLQENTPIIQTKGTGQYAAYGGNDRAIHMIQIPDNISSFTNALAEGIALMERIGFSGFLLGQSNLPNVRSAGQTAIIQANGNKRFANFLETQEDLIESPIIHYLWVAEALATKDKSLVVDGNIKAKSYSAFLQKQNQADDVSLFMQNVTGLLSLKENANPVSHAFLDSLIAEYVAKHGYDASQLVPNAENTEIGNLIQGQDNVNAPIAQLDGRSNVPADINQVI